MHTVGATHEPVDGQGAALPVMAGAVRARGATLLRCTLALIIIIIITTVTPAQTQSAVAGASASDAARAGSDEQRRMGRPPPRQMCHLTLRRERAEAAAGRGGPGAKGGGSALGTALSWFIPQRTVYLSPPATAGLAALPAVLIIYLLWTIHTGRDAKRALCQCWLLIGLVSVLLRWHIVTIAVEHAGTAANITLWQWVTTPAAVSTQLGEAFQLAPTTDPERSAEQLQDLDHTSTLRLYDSSHSAALPLSYLAAPEFIPQLQSPPGHAPRRFRLRLQAGEARDDHAVAAAAGDTCSFAAGVDSSPSVSFADAPVMDLGDLQLAAVEIASSSPPSSSLPSPSSSAAVIAAAFASSWQPKALSD